jgi:hypothetical protein
MSNPEVQQSINDSVKFYSRTCPHIPPGLLQEIVVEYFTKNTLTAKEFVKKLHELEDEYFEKEYSEN